MHEITFFISYLYFYCKYTMFESSITSLKLFHRGKVRDIYIVDDHHFLIIATDRLSAFDVVMRETVPEKGKILTKLTCFWFSYLKEIIPNHLTDIDPRDVVDAFEFDQVQDRAIVVHRCTPILIEAVVRGFLAGNSWVSYKQNNSICGVTLPSGLQYADRFSVPIFTPAKKAVVNEHDENITFDDMSLICGGELAKKIKNISLSLYDHATKYAEKRNILIADTKFEFGINDDGELILIDEILTPDSSRFWEKEKYTPGISPPSLDKQPVRDWLDQSSWEHGSPPPKFPDYVIQSTTQRYKEALNRLI